MTHIELNNIKAGDKVIDTRTNTTYLVTTQYGNYDGFWMNAIILWNGKIQKPMTTSAQINELIENFKLA